MYVVMFALDKHDLLVLVSITLGQFHTWDNYTISIGIKLS